MNKSSGCWTNEDTSDDECKDNNENCFMARGETSKVRSYNCERCNELQDILGLTLKESHKMMNDLKRLNKEVKDWKLKHEVCEIEKEVLQEKFEELKMQLNGIRKSTSHSSDRSNQASYKSTGEGPVRIESTSTNTNERPNNGLGVTCHYCNKSGHKYSFCRFRKANISGWIWKPRNNSKPSNTNPSRPKQAWEVTKIDGGSIKFGDDSKGKIIGTGTIPFNNNCDITEVYLVDGLNYNLLSISQLCDSGWSYLLTSMSDDPWLWHMKLGHASMHLIAKLFCYFHPFRSKCFIHNNGKDNLGKFDPRSDEGIFLGYSFNSRSFRVYNKRTLCVEESVHVIFDENNPSAEKGITLGDEDQAQKIQETSKSQKSTDKSDAMIESTNEIINSTLDHPKESTTHTVRPNEWRSELEYLQKFIIADPNEGMKTRGALKKKANIALIS
ncbi:uncharacterized protein [Nicotiana sylvestris]|uniref:uncharacterized protein n=1 Tax=Nicotiana sylvestris TaxID=4096 RepID=UPI00388C85B0